MILRGAGAFERGHEGIIAIAFVNHRNEARRLGHLPSAMGTAGWICGIVGTVASVAFWLLIIALAANSST